MLIMTSFLLQATYNAACLEQEDIREQNFKMQTEICDLKESLDRSVASNTIEVRLIILNTTIHSFCYMQYTFNNVHQVYLVIFLCRLTGGE